MTRECSIEVCPFETTSPLGMTAHARKHRNRFTELVGRPPDDYAEVRALLNRGVWPDDVDGEARRQLTLADLEEGLV